jgi:copper(I)-binding protein
MRMRRSLIACLPGFVLLGMSGAGHAATAPAGITIDQGWTTATAKSGATAQGFLTIHNAGTTPDVLRSVTCPVARRTVIENGQNHEVRAVPVEAEHSVRFTSAGLHLVLRHPHFRFYPQADIPCSALFDIAGRMMVYLHVEPARSVSYQPAGASRSGPG